MFFIKKSTIIQNLGENLHLDIERAKAEVQEQDLTLIILLPVMLVVSAQNIEAYHSWEKPHLISSHQKVQYPEIQYGGIHFTQLLSLLSSAACRLFWPLQDLTLLFIQGRPAISKWVIKKEILHSTSTHSNAAPQGRPPTRETDSPQLRNQGHTPVWSPND